MMKRGGGLTSSHERCFDKCTKTSWLNTAQKPRQHIHPGCPLVSSHGQIVLVEDRGRHDPLKQSPLPQTQSRRLLQRSQMQGYHAVQFSQRTCHEAWQRPCNDQAATSRPGSSDRRSAGTGRGFSDSGEVCRVGFDRASKH